jgi:outer membrane protein assembly factor BamB
MQWINVLLFLLAANAWAALLLGMLGLALVALGAWSWIRSRRMGSSALDAPGESSGRRRRPSVIMPLVGLLVVLAVAAAIGQHPQFFLQLFRFDYADTSKLAALQDAPLETHEQPAVPGEWPQWRGPHRDGRSTETGLRTDWKENLPAVLWKQPLGRGYSSIAVCRGRLYTMDRQGDQERVLCLEAATGRAIWSHAYAADYRRVAAIPGRENQVAGPRATPTVFDGRVYAVGAVGKFLCLEAALDTVEAKVLWEHDLAAEFDLFSGNPPRYRQWGIACSALIEGDLVIVQPGGRNASIVAFDRRTGERRWHSLDDESGYSSPVAATVAGIRQIIALTGKRVVGLRPSDGQLLWSYDLQTLMFANIATPIVAGDYVFVSAGYEMGCALLHLTPDATVEPVYFKTNKLMRNHHASCVLHHGYLYGFDNDFLKCVDLRTGTEVWHAGRAVKKGCLLFADDHLFVQTEDGRLMLVEATPSAFRNKGQIRVLEDSDDTWALPSLADGRLYLRDGTQVVCLDLRK